MCKTPCKNSYFVLVSCKCTTPLDSFTFSRKSDQTKLFSVAGAVTICSETACLDIGCWNTGCLGGWVILAEFCGNKATSNLASAKGAFTSGNFARSVINSGLGSAIMVIINSSAKVSAFTPEDNKFFKLSVICVVF